MLWADCVTGMCWACVYSSVLTQLRRTCRQGRDRTAPRQVGPGVKYHGSLVRTLHNKLYNLLSLFPPGDMNPHPHKYHSIVSGTQWGLTMFVPLKIGANAGHGSTGEAEACGSHASFEVSLIYIPSSKFQASLYYTVRPCLQIKNINVDQQDD